MSWFSIPATSTLYGTTTLTGVTAVVVATRFDISGLSGNQMRFGFTAATGLTSQIFALQALICPFFFRSQPAMQLLNPSLELPLPPAETLKTRSSC